MDFMPIFMVLLPAVYNSKKHHRRKLPRPPRRAGIMTYRINHKNEIKYICDTSIIPKTHRMLLKVLNADEMISE